MEFEIGTKVVKLSTQAHGFVHDTRQKRALVVEVKWEHSGVKQWLPAEELRVCDALVAPPATRITPWGRTTPAYLRALRKTLREQPKTPNKAILRKEEEKVADRLLSLSSKRKNRSKMKAKKIIAEFEARRNPGKRSATWFASLPEE